MTHSRPAPVPLDEEALLKAVPSVDGWKVLHPAALYAKIGQGGMGCVYRGRHVELEIDVAVKCLKPSLVAEDEQFEARFRREARLAAELTHENLVRLYELRRAFGISYLVLEFVEGETARDRVARKGPLREAEAATILLGAARGLAKAHRHREVIVHRDVKPENILVSREGEVKLADLGIAKALDRAEDATFTTQGSLGTPTYMAPEQWEDARLVGPPTDVWALGATLYFLLTGVNAIRGGSQQQIGRDICDKPFPDARHKRTDLSDALHAILDRCVEKDPARRYQDAGDLARDLEAFLGANAPSLLDKDSGAVKSEANLLSPPPAQALKKIRIAAGGGTSAESAESAAAVPLPPARRTGARAGARAGAARPARSAPPAREDRAARRALPLAWVLGAAALGLSGLVWIVLAQRDASPRPTPAPDPRKDVQAANPPRIELDLALPPDRVVYARGRTLTLAGRIRDAVGDRVRLASASGAPEYAVQPDGRFSIELVLVPDQRTPVELAHGGASVSFFAVQDSIDPEVELASPPRGKPTRETTAEIAVRVVEAHLDSVEIDGRPMTRGTEGRWLAPATPLPREGSNEFQVVARDASGREKPLTISIVRDTRAPRLATSEPAPSSAFEPGKPLDVELTFDEPVESGTLAGGALAIDGARGTGRVVVGAGAGEFTLAWSARDAAENIAQGVLRYRRESAEKAAAAPLPKPPTSPVRWPPNFVLEDPTPGPGDWAKGIRHEASGIVLILVPPGKFRMGSPATEANRGVDEVVHDVEITKPFYLAATETTRSQFASGTGKGRSGASVESGGRPQQGVTWEQAAQFCRALGGDLPTEAQWEYACRAGSTTTYSFGATIGTTQAAFEPTAERRGKPASNPKFPAAVPVRTFSANRWGFFDMHGNVWEWCRDGYVEDYAGLPRQDPCAKGSDHVLRGGSYLDHARGARSANRCAASMILYPERVGFRLAVNPE